MIALRLESCLVYKSGAKQSSVLRLTNAVLEIGALACVLAKVIRGSPGQRKICWGHSEFAALFNWPSLFSFIRLNQSTRQWRHEGIFWCETCGHWLGEGVCLSLCEQQQALSTSSAGTRLPRTVILHKDCRGKGDSTHSRLQWEATEGVACLSSRREGDFTPTSLYFGLGQAE